MPPRTLRAYIRRTLFAAFAVVILGGCFMGTTSTPPKQAIGVVHHVKYSGETLSVIALWYTGTLNSWKEILKFNKGLKPDKLKKGDTISIPAHLTTRKTELTLLFLQKNKVAMQRRERGETDLQRPPKSSPPSEIKPEPAPETSVITAPEPAPPAEVKKKKRAVLDDLLN